MNAIRWSGTFLAARLARLTGNLRVSYLEKKKAFLVQANVDHAVEKDR
jgi:hypothetical protein